MNLVPDDFPAFFQALWGYEPFPWQTRLAKQVYTSGWPEALDLPTASGKTAAIDIALFHLALEADKGRDRKAPVRIAFVVDRRLVVDGAYDRARCIAKKLADAEDGVLRGVADRLRGLAGDDEPLRAVRLRGGTPREPDWVRSPAQPTVVLSTVDQVGSRLLFRGYGVSDSMRPVHAGLLGSDALFLLDEAHLSQPFVETLGWVERYQSAPWTEAQVGPFAVVHLSATLPSTDNEPFGLTDADRTHHALQGRLAASKPAQLKPARSKLEEVPRLAGEFAAAARELAARDDSATVIAMVVNRVALARATHDALCQALAGDDGQCSADVTLLIGRSRPLDRDRLLKEVLPRMAASRQTDGQERPLYVVATQCIEAGADLDFDALVSQVAPLDCLRQRFGRLDRLGKRHQEGRESHAIILAAAGEVAKKAVDPIYGEAPAKTWEWLLERAGREKTVDFGIDHLELPAPADLEALLGPRSSAPVILPAYVDAFAQTSPAPGADPEVALFLHGPEAGPADVQIVWRADLDEADLHRGDRARAIVSACPPSSLEALAVPIAAARGWLANAEPPEIADVEGALVGVAEDRRVRDRYHRRALRWRGPDHAATGPIEPHEVRPADLIVVPATYGGCDAFGWNPSFRRGVADLGFEANLRHRRRVIFRLDRAVVRNALRNDLEMADRLWRRMSDCLEEWHEDTATLVSELAELDDLPEIWARALKELGPSGFNLEIRDAESPGHGSTLSLRRRLEGSEVESILGEPSLEARGGDPATEDDAGSLGRVPVALLSHCGDVEKLARKFASSAGLPAERVQDIALAACFHDLGKAESRFQVWLRGGDELAWLRDETPLAKSNATATLAEIGAARRRAGLPSRARHECWSVRLAECHPDLARAHDPDLVLWLIGSHHGYGRPFFPPVEYPGIGEELSVEFCGARLAARVQVPVWRLDSGWIERFERLKRRYGPWELARMEAILRLADHRASERAGSP